MTDADQLRAQIPASTDPERLEQLAREDERRRLTEFARWAIREFCFSSGSPDSFDVQEKAAELGLIVEVPGGYDPEKHGRDQDCWGAFEPGEQYFEFASFVKVIK